MAGYPGSERDVRVGAEALLRVVEGIFRGRGMTDADARLLADSLVSADLRGVHSHGVMRVPSYDQKLTTGGVNPTGRPRVVKDNGAALVVDGDNAMGQIGAAFAMQTAIARANITSVAAVALRGSNHCGALAYYARQALPAELIGLATTNALPTMAPWGGTDRILGINPLAVAIPAGQEIPPVIDFAFSHSAHGKIEIYKQKGLPIPAGWAFDRDGHATTDPAAALAGLLQPIGAYKGTGLALVMGILSSLLSGAAYGQELGSLEEGPAAGQDGQFFLVLKVAAFEDLGRFKERVDGIIREIHESRRAPGVERIYSPGELEAETERRYRAEGIPLPVETL
ncbi:MAG TPA: Ldh family oxidoreductase, partial [Chloroflexota bacterium]|nr:Ldh family oxidoreductase [Chloroflexota bacterium]